MITFKEAIVAAQGFAAEIFPPSELKGLRVEALRQSDDQRYWHITLGWVATDTRVLTPSSPMLLPNKPDVVEAPRVYKTFKINAATGSLSEMSDGA